MSDQIRVSRAATIAAEINYIKRQVLQVALSASIDIGRLLCEAKEAVPHGEWGGWLEANVEYSQTTANELMQLYRAYNDDQVKLFGRSNAELYGHLSKSQALALLQLPEPAREAFVETHAVEGMSVRELETELRAAREEAERERAARESAEGYLKEARASAEKYAGERKLQDANAAATEQRLRDELRKERERLEKAAKKAEREAADARKRADAATRASAEAAARIKALEGERDQLQLDLEAKPGPEVVEKIVEQPPADYDLLREDLAAAEKKLAIADKHVSRCGVMIEEMQRIAAQMAEELDAVVDEAIREKLRGAAKQIVAAVAARLEGTA